MREERHLFGDRRTEQDPFEILLQELHRPDELDRIDPHEVAALLLDPADPGLGQGLQLAGEAAEAALSLIHN